MHTHMHRDCYPNQPPPRKTHATASPDWFTYRCRLLTAHLWEDVAPGPHRTNASAPQADHRPPGDGPAAPWLVLGRRRVDRPGQAPHGLFRRFWFQETSLSCISWYHVTLDTQCCGWVGLTATNFFPTDHSLKEYPLEILSHTVFL